MDENIERISLAVDDEQLTDLKARLSNVRWPAGRTVSDTSQGPTLEKLQALVSYWRDVYDWRKAESELNAWGMYRTAIDGLDIDFLHIRSPEPGATPLVMTHGWPGSVLEFRKVIGPLTDPAAYGGDPCQAFHLVLPVLPGFGFAAKPAETGWTIPRIARAWVVLMDRLGYQRWGAQGGDLGCAVTDEIAALRPPGLIGTHLNFAMFQDTCGTPGDAEASFTYDELLDDVMMYWLPNSGASAARLYWEMTQSGWSSPARIDHPITVPVGFTMPPREAVRKSRRQVERRYSNVVFFHEPPAGGHFFALEQPAELVAGIRSTFARLT